MTTADNSIGAADTPSKKKVSVTVLPQPLVLITQIQRSGGTLLSQLFDGHPQVCAHPHELHIGRPKKWNWPDLNLSDQPEVWFQSLYEKRLEVFYEKGYVKPGSNPHARTDVHPFSFDPGLQLAIFLEVLKRASVTSQRDVLNAFFTSFFNAWSDISINPGCRIITAFCPRVLMFPDSTERFISDYPDGHIVSSVRDPRTWYASSSRHSSIYDSVAEAIDLWAQSTNSILELKRSRPEYVFVSTYEDLVSDTEQIMRAMAAFLGIDYDACLLMPTYASKPILPNSSYARQSYGVNTDSTKTISELNKDDLAYIVKEAMPLYEEASALSGS